MLLNGVVGRKSSEELSFENSLRGKEDMSHVTLERKAAPGSEEGRQISGSYRENQNTRGE